MPELPDVETFRRYFDSTALKQKISAVEVKRAGVLDGILPEELQKALVGRSFLSTRRHGKVLFAQTDGDLWLTVHFGMTGYFRYFRDLSEEPPHDRCLITFANGAHLAYDNRRMIGRIGLTPSPEEYVRRHDLGPDALTVDEKTFRSRLATRSGRIKQILMDQDLVAGIGNEYADEILFQSKIHPETKVGSLTDGNWRELYRASAMVLDKAVASEADTEKMPHSFLLPHRMKKGECPRCSSPLQHLKSGGRTAYFCPTCQPAP
ncbi:hypothetical protein LPW11_02960 [Geomonas sp. RF6]|uniref:Fpg/Nei family DNA glycosylase n=1 Tax=Geomonas sp. RF6 TaxID=2897342 RepID=UPI001E3F5E1F|nr:DNA-formamidopyrimidine glycosylase family protein [Geomonas sp. RF6]UFS71160.1 hypothetical protein LPW11_02960 [Geomonas sp. RF6]